MTKGEKKRKVDNKKRKITKTRDAFKRKKRKMCVMRKQVRWSICREETEIFKALKFVFGSRQRLIHPRRSPSNTLHSLGPSHTDSIHWRRISSREISRAISATDFYAAITPRFSFLFSSSCASFYAHSYIRLFSGGRGRWVLSQYGKSVTSSIPTATCTR